MRYLVTASVKPGCEKELLDAIDAGTLGEGSVAEGEYLRNMSEARVDEKRDVRWVEVCFCATPLEEERPYWERYFTLKRVKDAHARTRCQDENGTQPWACGECDCSRRLEAHLAARGAAFVEELRREGGPSV